MQHECLHSLYKVTCELIFSHVGLNYQAPFGTIYNILEYLLRARLHDVISCTKLLSNSLTCKSSV